jgi:hypothetical protein
MTDPNTSQVSADPEFVCLGCGGPREIESEKPGITKYKPCAACGTMGLERVEKRPPRSTGKVTKE